MEQWSKGHMPSSDILCVVSSNTHMKKLNSHQVSPGNIKNVPVVGIFPTNIDNPIIKEVRKLFSVSENP